MKKIKLENTIRNDFLDSLSMTSEDTADAVDNSMDNNLEESVNNVRIKEEPLDSSINDKSMLTISNPRSYSSPGTVNDNK